MKTIALMVSLVLSAGMVADASQRLMPGTGKPKYKKSKPPTLEERERDVKADISAYVSCANAFADAHANGSGTPTEIADAATGECGREFSKYQAEARDYLVSVVSDRGYETAVRQAETDAKQFREDVRLRIIGRVLKERDAPPAQK